MIKKIIIFLLLTRPIYAQQPVSKVVWPEVTTEAKPWTRLWWPGSIATKEDITAALEKYSKIGLGGAELTVLYGVRGQEDKFVDYLTPAWMNMFQYILKESQRLKLGLDLANASGWPFGGPWVTDNDASRYLAYRTYSLNGGESLSEKIEYRQEPVVRWSGTYRTDISNITDPVSKNSNLQELSIDQIRFPKLIPLVSLMAYSDNGQVLDLTGKVSDGMLEWKASPGKWTLYATFGGWHGKMVERAGPGGEGYVIDHFSLNAIKNYLKKFDDSFRGYDIENLRGYFNDSYEVDDARGQSDWTPEMYTEFRERRGYDLRLHLPALLQKDDPEKNARVLSDYRQTISDLMLDNFTKYWTSWANKQGRITRNQSHGSPANILDLYAASDIPETEGTDIFRAKFATSAANVSGKKLVSAEAATWLGEHFSSTLLDVKKNVDNYFIAGVNHIVYHGTCFSPENEPWPGFQFYAAVEFSPANSFWNDFEILNKYVTRVQSFSQNSKPDNDILLYFPVFDRYSDFNNSLIEHFDGISVRFRGSKFMSAAEHMNQRGYSFDYISDLQLGNVIFDENFLHTGGAAYKTIILPQCKYIPVTTFNRIINLADKGATVIFYGELPDDVSGWNQLEENREMFQFLKEQLTFKESGAEGITIAAYGQGRIVKGEDLEKLLSFAGIRREPMTDSGLKFNRRKRLNTTCYFIRNESEKPFMGQLTLEAESKSAAIFNPVTGSKGIVRAKSEKGRSSVWLQLSPWESTIVVLYPGRAEGDKYSWFEPAANQVLLNNGWEVTFTEGGPTIPPPVKTGKLVSWTEFGETAYGDFSGTAGYKTSFTRPEARAEAWEINLGRVCESARVYLNGKEIAALIGPEYRVVIENRNLLENNELVVKVSNLSANRISWLDRNNIVWKKFYNVNFASRLPQNRKEGLFDASGWTPRESGLIGPVTLTPVKRKR